MSSFRPSEVKQKYVLVTCRHLTQDESTVLNRFFKSIIVHNPVLNGSHVDLSTMAFDLLIINARTHLALEMIKPQCQKLGIPITLLKTPLCNCKELAAALGATIISKVEDMDPAQMEAFLTKERLPKLKSRWVYLVKKVLGFLLKL